MPNLFDDVPVRLQTEQFVGLLQRPGVRIERIVSTGHCDPEGQWQDQAWDEWVLLLAGAARLAIEGAAELALRPGDHLLVPARRRHRVAWTDPERPTIWLAVHFDG